AIERPDGAWQADLALFCVKGYQNEEAIEVIRPAVGKDTTILTLQNGIGSADQLASAFGREKVMSGAAYIDAMRKAPGVVAELGGECRIVFGEEDGRETERAVRIRDTLHKVGIETHLSRNVSKVLWNKLIYICALSGMTCITRASFAEVMGTPETLDLTWRVMREAAEAGRAKGIDLDEDVVESTMAGFQEYKEDLISSMHLDLEAGNPLEIAFLNGAVSRIGKEVGVATPVNDFITACLSIADGKARRT
ncbi:MAG: 2-dehydropantoate 2-reductase, partial [Chloroflexi bacterium]|nr:2-dehydropantoate 2-reductase [Chloroflexota bacterium]